MTKNWIITGASSGIGRALAEAALEAGDTVTGAMRRPERVADLAQRYETTFLPVAFDVRETATASTLTDQATQRFGPIDVLVNNGGVGRIGAAEEVTDDELRDMVAQHLFGPAALVRAALPQMRERRTGTIVQLSSQGGRRSFPGVGAYHAGKFALEGWSEALAQEVAPFGVRVMIVEPSRFRTGFNAADVMEFSAESGPYAEALGELRSGMRSADGVQEGDPVRAARIIHDLVNGDELPLRLPLGRDSIEQIGTSYRTNLAELEKWADVAASADFPIDPANEDSNEQVTQ